MSKRYLVACGSVVLAISLIVVGAIATARPAEAACWDYPARYKQYIDWCLMPGQDCLVVTCQSY